MAKSTGIVVSILLIASAVGGYFYWQSMQNNDALVDATSIDQPEASPEIRQLVEASPDQTPLPGLAESDSYMFEAMASLLGNETLMNVFINKTIIQHIVATIDNLPSMSAPRNVMPVAAAAGSFIVAGSGSQLTISPENAQRYTPYMNVVDAMDAKKLVALYVRVYPLFQQAYEELGYPDKYFNDRLLYVINDLLEAPDVAEPVKLVQPLVVYKYADPELEARNIGQRTIMRIGSTNEAKVKAKLLEIKNELLGHMHDKQVKDAG